MLSVSRNVTRGDDFGNRKGESMTEEPQHTLCPDSGDVWHAHRVSYGETDTMGVLYYAEYLHIFERARGTLIRLRGMSYRTVEERGIYLPVREASCRYRAPARYDDLVYVRIKISEWGRASVAFAYELFGGDKQSLLASGMTRHAVVNEKGRPVAVPCWLKNALGE